MKLYSPHLYLDTAIMHTRVYQMQTQNRNPEYTDTYIVQSSQDDHYYLTAKVRVLDVPKSEADAVVDTVEVWVCSCDDFHFRQSDGFENGDVRPSELGECKHIDSVVRESLKTEEKDTPV